MFTILNKKWGEHVIFFTFFLTKAKEMGKNRLLTLLCIEGVKT
jgi:hypothetical protein